MKKLLAIFLFIILLFNTTGYYLSFMAAEFSAKTHAWLMRHQQETGAGIINLQFQTYNGTLAGADIRFLNETEFVYKGRLYDLINRTEANGVVTFKCYCDDHESAAITDLSKQIENRKEQPASNHAQSPLKELFKYYTAYSNNLFLISPPVVLSLFNVANILPVVAVFHNVITPPPDTLRA